MTFKWAIPGKLKGCCQNRWICVRSSSLDRFAWAVSES